MLSDKERSGTPRIEPMTDTLGFDIPARVGMPESQIQTPCLVLDLDALERNIRRMGDFAASHEVKHRAHAKMHKSVDVARLQERLGGISGLCCQKVSEAEVFVDAGFRDILISNQIRDPLKIERLARLATTGARILVCVDDVLNVDELNAAAQQLDVQMEVLVEIDCGAGRCGTRKPEDALAIAQATHSVSNLKFSGIQAYNGSAQHVVSYQDREAAFQHVIERVNEVVNLLSSHGIGCELVTGAGTGSYMFEAASQVFNELQCGSYAFMDADYGRIEDSNDNRWDETEWEHALFVLASVMSQHGHLAVLDAGLKSMTLESGLPVVSNLSDCRVLKCNDEHSMVEDSNSVLRINDRVRLIPGHCDPTCNLHDCYVGVRNGVVEAIWPVSARGRSL